MKPTRFEGSSIWRDTAEQIEWYGNMSALEKAFAKEGIPAIAITAEMACRWRATGVIGKNPQAVARGNASAKARAKASAPTCDLNGVGGVKRRTTAKGAI